MKTSPTTLLALFYLAVLLPGCPTEPDPVVGPDPADGVDPSIAAAEGEARAGRVRPGAGEEALFGGIAAEGQVGDFMIYNRFVQFVIQDAYPSHGYVDTGGHVIDADLVRPAGVLGRDPIDDLFLGFGIAWLFDAADVGVTADGSDGAAAVVRATGTWKRWQFIEGAVETDLPILPETDFEIVNEYSLPPESFTLTMTSRFTNRGSEVANINPTTGWLASEEDLWAWAAHQGLRPDDLDELDAVGAVGKWGEASFSFWPDTGTLRSLGIAALVSSAGISATTLGWTEVAPGETLTMVRHFSVGPDTLTVEAERMRSQGQSMGSVSGVVTDTDGVGVPNVRVHFVEAGAAEPDIAGFAATGADGSFVGELAPGDWDVYAVGRGMDERVDLPLGAGRYAPFAAEVVNDRQLAVVEGSDFADPLDLATGWPTPAAKTISVVDGGSAEVEFEMESPGTLVIDVTDGDNSPIPAYAEIVFADGFGAPDTVPAELKEALGVIDGGRYARVWIADGHVELPVLPGTYDIAIEHSWRHARGRVEGVEVPSGGTGSAAASLEQIVARDGWLSMDSHLHAAPSNDGSLAMEHRLVACAATGVDLPVTTDHDRMADYRPLAEALGLSDRMQVIPGVEVSPVARGHFNLFPVDPKPLELINGGAEPWWIIPESTTELHERIRATGTEDSILQVNHGRSGMFSYAGYGPANGLPNDEDFWSWDFDVFELINGSGRGDIEELKEDWFSFLNHGQLKVPTGVSDSHSRSSPCGYGRTDVFLDRDDPGSVTGAELRAAVVAGHVVVAGGLTLRADIGGAIPGDVVVGNEHVVAARVFGTDWMPPTEVRLIRNGEVVEVVPVTATEPENSLWIEVEFAIDEADDAWFVVEVEGAASMGGVWRGGVPYAITGAFLVDVDGDGWTAPLL